MFVENEHYEKHAWVSKNSLHQNLPLNFASHTLSEGPVYTHRLSEGSGEAGVCSRGKRGLIGPGFQGGPRTYRCPPEPGHRTTTRASTLGSSVPNSPLGLLCQIPPRCNPGLLSAPALSTQNSTWFRHTRLLARRPSCVHSERLRLCLDTRVLACPHRAEQASGVRGTGRRGTPLPGRSAARGRRPPGCSAPAEAGRTERSFPPRPSPLPPRPGRGASRRPSLSPS